MPRKLNLDTTVSQKAVALFSRLLFSGRKLYLSDLARELKCSKPTIIRLITAIETSDAGQIESGLDRGRRWYQLHYLSGAAKAGLSADEVEKLALCRDLLERLLPIGIERMISRGIEKIFILMSSPENRAEVTATEGGRSIFGRIDVCERTERRMDDCPVLPKLEGAFGLVGYEGFWVRVVFCAEFSGFIRERFWSERQEIIDMAGGGVELRFQATDEDELMGWVLSFGNGAELLEPEHIRRRLFGEIQDLWDMYSEGDYRDEPA